MVDLHLAILHQCIALIISRDVSRTKGETVFSEWKANCRRTKGPRGWPHPSRHQHGKALKLGRLLTRVVHVPPPCERVKYGVTRFPSKPVIRLEGVVSLVSSPLSCFDGCRSQTISMLFLASLNRHFQRSTVYTKIWLKNIVPFLWEAVSLQLHVKWQWMYNFEINICIASDHLEIINFPKKYTFHAIQYRCLVNSRNSYTETLSPHLNWSRRLLK